MMKKICSILLICVLVLSFVGCNNPAPNSTAAPNTSGAESTKASEKETEKQTDATTAPAEPVSLRFSWWGNDTRHERTIEVIKMYQDLHPNVTIEAEYRGKSEQDMITTQLASGTCADIVQLNPPWMGELTTNGDFFVDLAQYDFDVDGFDQSLIENYCTYNDTLIALPSGVNARDVLINTTMLSQFDIDLDIDTKLTWDDLITIGEKVHQQDPAKYFMAADKSENIEFILRPYIIQKTGKAFISDDYEMGFTRDDLIEGLTFLASLYSKGVTLPASEANTYLNSSWTNPDWLNGNIGMLFSWTSLLLSSTGDSDQEFSITQLPVREGALDTATVVKPSQVYSICKTCANPDVAADFLNFLLTNEEAGAVLGDTRGIPPYEKVQNYCMEKGVLDSRVIIATQFAQENSGMYENSATTNSEIVAALQDAGEIVSYDPSKVEQAADQALLLINDILNSLK